MKIFKCLGISFLLAFFLASFYLTVKTGSIETEIRELSFSTKMDKNAFVLGEPVEVEFILFNNDTEPVFVPFAGVEVGSLKVFIAENDGEFKEYFGLDWGVHRGSRVILQPNETREYTATLLWNGTPNVSHLSQATAKQVLKGKITTEYALPEPGVYRIKGLSYVGENATPIESEEAKVVVTAPEGDDLTVWNQIKGNREIAILMQTGEFYSSKDEEKNVSEVEQIILQYPNSVYSKYLKPNLDKFKENREKRREFLRKTKRP